MGKRAQFIVYNWKDVQLVIRVPFWGNYAIGWDLDYTTKYKYFAGGISATFSGFAAGAWASFWLEFEGGLRNKWNPESRFDIVELVVGLLGAALFSL